MDYPLPNLLKIMMKAVMMKIGVTILKNYGQAHVMENTNLQLILLNHPLKAPIIKTYPSDMKRLD